MEQEDLLKTLEIKPGTSLGNAQRAFWKLSKVYHPDRHGGDETKYRAIFNAYQAVRNDPSLLEIPKDDPPGYIRLVIEATLEDLYLGRIRVLRYARRVPCRVCTGSGSSRGPTGACPECNGTGQIDSEVLAIMGREGTCPHCGGLGVQKDHLCPSCKGSKTEEEIAVRKVSLHPTMYHKKVTNLKGEGDFLPNQGHADVLLKVEIKEESPIIVKNGCFEVPVKILPAQRVIGEELTIELFGRKIPFRIPKDGSDPYVKDTIPDGSVREIRFRMIEVIPTVTEETEKLYREILSIERTLPVKVKM